MHHSCTYMKLLMDNDGAFCGVLTLGDEVHHSGLQFYPQM